MRNKLQHAHLWLNQNYHQIKHVLVVLLGVILLVFSMVSLGNQNRLLKENAKLTAATKRLGEDNKRLNITSQRIAKQNQAIAKQNRAYTLCVAKIFALYTHNFVPIEIENFNSCTTNNIFGEDVSDFSTESQSPLPVSSSSSSSNHTPSASQSKPDNSQSGGDNGGGDPKLLDCKVDLLGIHLGCP